MTPEPDPCLALGCTILVHPVGMCRDKRCCYHWQREARERKEREAKIDKREVKDEI